MSLVKRLSKVVPNLRMGAGQIGPPHAGALFFRYVRCCRFAGQSERGAADANLAYHNAELARSPAVSLVWLAQTPRFGSGSRVAHSPYNAAGLRASNGTTFR